MRRPGKILAVVLFIGLLGLAYGRVVNHFNNKDTREVADRSCATLDQPRGNLTTPVGFMLPRGQKLLEVRTPAGRTFDFSRGRATYVEASVPGTRSDIVAIRDRVAQQLTGSGYQVTERSQNPNIVAGATISKNGARGAINLSPLCSGKVLIRYTLRSG